jgi:uncharacterized membrane protein YqhA
VAAAGELAGRSSHLSRGAAVARRRAPCLHLGGDREAGLSKLIEALFWVRGLMLLASVGSILCSLLMFVVGFDHLIEATKMFFGPASGDKLQEQVTVEVLQSIDAFLFALVFIIFAYGITLGFVFRLAPRLMHDLPRWMKIEGIGELKQTLVEVVLVGLIIAFARIAVEQGRELDWDDLVLPIAIFMLAGSLKLIRIGEPHHTEAELREREKEALAQNEPLAHKPKT